jgi:hypothetical protein
MQTKNPNTFLKVTSGVLAFGILVLGTVFHEKNTELFSNVHPNLNEASVVTEDANLIPTILGNCEQNSNIGVLSALQPEQSLFASVSNLDAVITGTASFDTGAMNALAIAVAENRIEAKIIESGAKYEFIVKDGQINFWKCILNKNELFSSISDAAREVEFFSNTATFEEQMASFSYGIDKTRNVEQFLNFMKLPDGHQVLETTILNSDGETFFKIFEVELNENEITFNDLRQDLRSRVGVTNLRPAVFGPDSYYWMWGEDDRMAASVFPIEGKVFGVSYQSVHFKHIRRAMDTLRDELPLLVKKVELVRKKGGMFEDIGITDFENLSQEELGSQTAEALKQLESAEDILAENLASNILELSEPIEIPENVEVSTKDVPVDLN